MKKILLSVSMIAVVAVVVMGATGAFFSDTETSTGNTFTAGAIDLKVDSTQHYNGMICEPNTGTNAVANTYWWRHVGNNAPAAYPVEFSACDGSWTLTDLQNGVQKFFNFTDIKPGDSGENTISLHVLNNDAWTCVDVNVTKNDGNGLTEPEALVDTTDGAGQGELAQNLYFTAWADDGDNVWETGEPLLFTNQSGPASDVLGGKSYALADSTTPGHLPLTGDVTTNIGLAWCAGTQTVDTTNHTITCNGSTMGNNTQTDSMEASIAFRVEQSRNNANFKCSDVNGTEPTTEVVYNSIPDPLKGNYPSQAFEAQSASEFGGQVLLTGTDRNNPKVTVMMSSWGCETGTWSGGTCSTTPGATFTHPITLNIYNVGSGDSVGTLITSKTESFAIPYRPSKNVANCSAGGGWWDGATCFNGFATPISFNLTGVTLPNKVIVSLAYNTTNYGNTPMGATTCSATTQGCGYDSLNVALNTLGSVTYPLPNGAYLNSSWSGAYNDGGAITGTFRLDPTGWTGYQPIIKVEAN